MAYFPFMMDISGKQCLIVGGGKIAYHKIKILMQFDVNIKVIAEQMEDEIKQLLQETAKNTEIDVCNPVITLLERGFEKQDLQDIDFVIAATDDERLNHEISSKCKELGILVNAVDQREDCSFIFPAIIKEKKLVVAVSTAGQSPAGAAYVKRKIRSEIPSYYGDMIEQLGRYRDEIVEGIPNAATRKEIFNRLLAYGDNHNGQITKDIIREIISEYQ